MSSPADVVASMENRARVRHSAFAPIVRCALGGVALAMSAAVLASCVSSSGGSGSGETAINAEVTIPRFACDDQPGSATDLTGQPDWVESGVRSWTDRSRCLVRVDVLMDGSGPAHCGQEDADYLAMGDELGERYGTAGVEELWYARDPKGVFGLPAVSAAFEPDATLPKSAMDSGYSRDGIDLHVDPADPSAIWLAYPDGHVELWPLADLPLCL